MEEYRFCYHLVGGHLPAVDPDPKKAGGPGNRALSGAIAGEHESITESSGNAFFYLNDSRDALRLSSGRERKARTTISDNSENGTPPGK